MKPATPDSTGWLSCRDNCCGARADRHSKGRRGSLLRRRGEIKVTVPRLCVGSRIVQEADLRGEDTARSRRWWPLRGREIEAAFVMHHDLKEALVAGQPDARLFHGCMLRRVDQQFPHRTKEQDGATERNSALILSDPGPLVPPDRVPLHPCRERSNAPRPGLVRAG